MGIFHWEHLSYPSPPQKAGITSKCIYCGPFTSITWCPTSLEWAKGHHSKKQMLFPLSVWADSSQNGFETFLVFQHTPPAQAHQARALQAHLAVPSTFLPQSVTDTHCCACSHPSWRYFHWFSFILLLFVVAHIIEAALSACAVNLSHCLTSSLWEAVRIDSQ